MDALSYHGNRQGGQRMVDGSEGQSFRALLRRHRLHAGLTQEQLAERAGLSRRGIADLERGARTAPYADTVERLASALDLSDDERTILLQAVRQSARSSAEHLPAHTDTGGDDNEPVFVGRDAELETLRTACVRASQGRGGLVFVVGEPGIGKTTLCRQLTSYASTAGMQVLSGALYEEPSLSLPYLPFIEALRTYIRTIPSEQLATELGHGAPHVARMLPELHTRLRIAPVQLIDPEQDRWSLLNAVTDFLRSAANARPIVLFLDDLQWADRGTLDLLLFLSRNLAGARLLVLGTYREAEIDRAHPLSTTLMELRRGAGYSRLQLGGLSVPEVQTMLVALARQDISTTTAEKLHEQTEGNPLFVQEIVRDLVEQGLVERIGGSSQLTRDAPLAVRLPRGVRDVIGRRLSRLSQECNRLLAIAAVIGREFGLRPLRETIGLSEEQLLDALEEAQRAHVIEDHSAAGQVTFRFTHALFRETLYEELFAPRRLMLHQRLARVLEKLYATDLETHAAELAEHFAQTSDSGDLEKALHYARVAARRATLVSAHGEAARHMRLALHIQQLVEPARKAARCDLLLELGQASILAGDTADSRVTDIATEALTIAEDLADAHRAFLACSLGALGLGNYGGRIMTETHAYRVWIERMARYATEGTAEHVSADNALAIQQLVAGQERAARELHLQALTLSRKLAASSRRQTNSWWLGHQFPHGLVDSWNQPAHRQRERLELVDEFAPGLLLDPRGTSAPALLGVGEVYLTFRDRHRAEAIWSRLQLLAEDSKLPLSVVVAHRARMMLGCLDGNLDEVRHEARAMVSDAEAQGAGMLARATAAPFIRRALLHAGHIDEALAGFPEDTQRAAAGELPMFGLQGVFAAQRAVCLAHAERFAEANAIVDHFLEDRPIGAAPDETPMPIVVALLEASVLTGHTAAVERLVPHLAVAADLMAVANTLTVIARHLSAAMLLLGDRAQALNYAEQALVVAENVGFRPEAALIRLQLAELEPERANSRGARSPI